jgi:ankyrin repeat protein
MRQDITVILIVALLSVGVRAGEADGVDLKPDKQSDKPSPEDFADFGAMRMLKKYVEADPEILKKAQGNFYPLHVAALSDAGQGPNLKTVEYLIEHGADVNALTVHGGYTPLHLAVSKGQYEYASFLIKHGADVKITSDEQFSVMDFAIYAGCTKFQIESKDAGGWFGWMNSIPFANGLAFPDDWTGREKELTALRIIVLLDDSGAKAEYYPSQKVSDIPIIKVDAIIATVREAVKKADQKKARP